jgi:hypothetical protein
VDGTVGLDGPVQPPSLSGLKTGSFPLVWAEVWVGGEDPSVLNCTALGEMGTDS